MENSWKTHGISFQQFGRHPGIRKLTFFAHDVSTLTQARVTNLRQKNILYTGVEYFRARRVIEFKHREGCFLGLILGVFPSGFNFLNEQLLTKVRTFSRVSYGYVIELEICEL